MNILVTGATGFIGKNLINSLKKKYSIYVIIRPTTDKTKIGVDNYFVFDDNISELSKYIKDKEIKCVIHLASLYIADHKTSQIKDLVLSNVYFSTALLDACVKADVCWFINTGTIWQNFNAKPFTDEYCPVNLYAASKQAFIDISKYYTEISSIKFVTIKLCDTYGPNDTRQKIYSLFDRISKTGEQLKMSPGQQKIDIVHVSKVIESFESLIVHFMNNGELKSEYVVTSGKQIPLKQLAANYEQQNNVKLNIVWGGRDYRCREVMIPYIGTEVPK